MLCLGRTGRISLRQQVDRKLQDEFHSNIKMHLTLDPQIILLALAGVAQWTEQRPVNQRVVSSIPSQGTCLGCGPRPQLGPCETQQHIDVSLLLSLSPFPSL